jgi:hypothetical protein
MGSAGKHRAVSLEIQAASSAGEPYIQRHGDTL